MKPPGIPHYRKCIILSCEQLPSVSVSAKDLVLLPAAVVKPTPRSERSVEDIAGVLSTHCESIEVIQNKINCLAGA